MESSFNKQEKQSMLGAAVESLAAGTFFGSNQENECWLFRDDIGAPHGIKGYEEQVNSVGMHHGHSHWPSEIRRRPSFWLSGHFF